MWYYAVIRGESGEDEYEDTVKCDRDSEEEARRAFRDCLISTSEEIAGIWPGSKGVDVGRPRG